MVKVYAGGDEKPEREEVVEPLEEPTPERRKERRKEPVPEKEPEKVPAQDKGFPVPSRGRARRNYSFIFFSFRAPRCGIQRCADSAGCGRSILTTCYEPLVLARCPALQTQPLHRGQGDHGTRCGALPFDLQASPGRRVAHGALAQPEDSGGFPGIHVVGSVPGYDGRFLLIVVVLPGSLWLTSQREGCSLEHYV